MELYVWKAPRVQDPEEAARLVAAWSAGDQDVFEDSTDVGWFQRELREGMSMLQAARAAASEAPAPTGRVVRVPLAPDSAHDTIEDVFSLAMKYDLLVYDPRRQAVVAPLEAMLEHESATFWPRGAIRSVVVTGIAVAAGIAAWFANIPIVSGLVVIVAAFMLLLTIVVFVSEGRKRLGR